MDQGASVVDEGIWPRQDALRACEQRDLGALSASLAPTASASTRSPVSLASRKASSPNTRSGRRRANALATFEAFAVGLGMPAVARRTLGLA